MKTLLLNPKMISFMVLVVAYFGYRIYRSATVSKLRFWFCSTKEWKRR